LLALFAAEDIDLEMAGQGRNRRDEQAKSGERRITPGFSGTKEEARGSACLSGKLQTAEIDRAKARMPANDCSHGGKAKSLVHRNVGLPGISRTEDDQLGQVDSPPGKSRRIKAALRIADNKSFVFRADLPGHEKGQRPRASSFGRAK
jgi:hypothetical protein